MAVFLINICKFNGCGITFPSLGDLIQHIEDTHIGEYPGGRADKWRVATFWGLFRGAPRFQLELAIY